MLASWKKSYDKPRQHIKKQRHHTVDNAHLVKAMVFPVTMYGSESWTIKKAKCWRIDAFELWCWRRLLRVPGLEEDQTSQSKGNKLWIFIGRTDAKAEAPILWLPDAKNWLTRLRAGGEGDDREWDGWMASPTQLGWVWAISRSWWRTGKPDVLQSMGSQRFRHDWVTELNRRDQECKFLWLLELGSQEVSPGWQPQK